MVSLGPPARFASTNPQASEEIQRAMAASAASGQPRPPSLFSEIGPDGAVHFGGVPQGQYFVTVECRAHNLRQGPSTISVGAEPISGLEWQVERGLGLSVLVVDENKQPLPG